MFWYCSLAASRTCDPMSRRLVATSEALSRSCEVVPCWLGVLPESARDMMQYSFRFRFSACERRATSRRSPEEASYDWAVNRHNYKNAQVHADWNRQREGEASVRAGQSPALKDARTEACPAGARSRSPCWRCTIQRDAVASGRYHTHCTK